ncbi:hypothetical protein [Kribbella speibonae]|uniref:Uncharacterized protein n=1 Tax=Kribbella speibonae TaxID=1572660 RepID=A0ABY1ZY21_9ACTN|nr:hypothetical protein [Kribbella speibonae]TCC20093.1 hypothetical protein E0H58_28590 [Kribbella speibonae]
MNAAVAPAKVVIEPDIDIYGKYIRVSALADYLEIAALADRRVTEASLADIIVDNEWVRRPTRQFIHPENVDEDPGELSKNVFNLLRERQAVLGDTYPFEQAGKALRRRSGGPDPVACRYTALLALTAVHAWKIPSEADPEPTLEQVVMSVLSELGLTAVNIGATDRGSGFKDAVVQGGQALGLQPMDDPMPRSVRAKDSGVDTLAGAVWRDGRPGGQWVFIGQVTVAKSSAWKDKLAEPEPPRWAKFLQEPLHPQAFLAVPYHVETDFLRELLVSQRGAVLDRLRLVSRKAENTEPEVTLIKSLLECPVA